MTDTLPGEGLDGLADSDAFAQAMRATRLPMLIADARAPDSPIIFANDAFLDLTGYGRDEIMGRNCRFLQGPDTDPVAIQQLHEAVQGRRDTVVEALNYRKDGSTFWNTIYLSPVWGQDGRVAYFFGAQVDVTEKKQAELALRQSHIALESAMAERTAELRHALAQKTALLHEVDHRVKNNLQLIASLLLMQIRREADPAVKRALSGMQERINAIATVHRRLFQSEDVAMFDFAAFVHDLADDALGAADRPDIKISLEAQPARVPAALAAPLALVVNELLLNALNHGFPAGHGGMITLAVTRGRRGLRIEVADNGVGMGRSSVGQAGLGLTIVDLLSQQLRADVTRNEAGPGVRTVLELPLEGVS